VFAPATVPPLVVFAPATVPPLVVFAPATVPPLVVFAPATVPPPRSSTAAAGVRANGSTHTCAPPTQRAV
jgi:hypothetical protein